MNKNDILELEIIGMTLQGDGVARRGGLAVFVPGVCPGDTVRALILKVKPNCAFAKCLEVLTPGPGRIDAGCAAFPRCGGCAFRCLDYGLELEIKQREARETLRRIGGIEPLWEPILGAASPERCRNKAMLPVQAVGGRVRAGFYMRNSHRVVYGDDRKGDFDCLLQPKAFAHIAEAVCEWAQAVKCSLYDEKTGEGLLRHIYLRQGESEAGTQILVCLVVNGFGVPRADLLLQRLRGASRAVRGVMLSHNTRDTNVVLGDSQTLLWGSERVTQRLGGLDFTLSARSFFQVNPAQAERLYRLAERFADLTGQERVLDLYCGTGAAGLTMAGRCAELVGVEIVPQAVEDARHNAVQNGISNARFLCMDAAKAAIQLSAEGWKPDVTLLDPPRRGCEPALLRTVAGMVPRRVVYVSCDPSTLARDLALLRELGYHTTKAAPVDMFPRTGHVECVALAERAG